MTHTILHVGDMHLCSTHPRNADRLSALDQIARRAEACETLAAVLIPGDLFHQRSTVQDRNDLACVLQRLAARAPVFLCAGNHDEPQGLSIFSRIKATWPILVAERASILEAQTPTGINVTAFVLPWPHKSGLVAAGIGNQEITQTARELLDPIFISAGQSLKAAALEGDLPVMMAHATIGGARSSTGQPQIGQSGIDIDPALLARLGPIYKAFNHIHAHQSLHGAVYAGSLARLDFAETEPKGVIEIEYQRDGGFWAHRWRFVTLDVPAMVHVDGALSRDGLNILRINGDAVPGYVDTQDPAFLALIRGADVRVRYEFLKAEVNALDVAHIHAAVAGCRSLKLDPVPLLEHTIRAPEIQQAETLEAKVRAYAEHVGLPITDGLVAKVSALQAGDGAGVLQYVVDGLPSVTVEDHPKEEVA